MKLPLSLSLLLCATLVLPSRATEAPTGSNVELVPAFKVSDAELAMLKENNQILKANQSLVRRILLKEHLEVYSPEIPHYQLMSENSLLAVLNQLEYLELCHKFGVPKPPRPKLETGTALQNNRFLHAYNNELLHAICQKLSIKEPEIDLHSGTVSEQDNRLVKQNSDMLGLIADHLGIKH